MSIFSGATDLLKQARKTVLAKGVEPVLREAGFRVTAALSTRVTPSVTSMVALENGRFNNAFGLTFHFDLGVYYGNFVGVPLKRPIDIHKTGKPAVAILGPSSSGFGPDVGSYQITPDVDLDALAARLRDDFTSRFLPWLDELSSIDGALGYLDRQTSAPDWKQNENAYLSVMLLGHAGRLDEARRRFEGVTGDRAAHLKRLSQYGIVL
jgi:hypothetical protein